MPRASNQRPERGRLGRSGIPTAACSRPWWLYLALCLALCARAEAGVANPAPAAGPEFHSSLAAACRAAGTDQSLVLLVFSANWCVPCKQLKAQTLDSAELKVQAGALHVADVDVDAETGTARDYQVEAVPTLVLLTPEQKVVARREGFLTAAELLQWLREGRQRAKEGKWEGTAAGGKLTEFTAKAAADRLETNDLMRLVELLGDSNPATRDGAAGLLLAQRDPAVDPLILALTNAYLGVRIGASEVLHKLAPAVANVEPWQSPSELAGNAAGLKQWWESRGKLPEARPEPAIDAAGAASIGSALDALRGSDPAQRTDAMSSLVARGAAALPAVREALKLSEKNGDQRSVTLLEDVRWAILIPDVVENRAPGVRNALARGKGPERQGAASRLGGTGREAIPALAELVEDADPLVVESAVRALASVGGKDALPAMIALLKAGDSNLRMTAAQALGHTRNAAAVQDLLPVLGDSNEVVVCTALAALEEIHGERNYAPQAKPLAPELVQGLKRCLGDDRWRVRAAAAEAAGKLVAKDLVDDLNKLLNDADGFVVKSALEALQKLSSIPEPEKLLAVVKRHNGLRGEALGLLVNAKSDDAVKAVSELYQTSDVEGRLGIVRELGAAVEPNQETSAWQPLLAQAAVETDSRLRRAVAEVLATRPPKVAAALVGPLLADADEATRIAAAGAVLSVVGGERQTLASSHGSQFSEVYFSSEVEESLAGESYAGSRPRATKTNEPPATAEQLAAWNGALQKNAGQGADLLTAVALYVTGPSNTGLPGLQAAFGRADHSSVERLAQSAAVAAIIPRLPWPDGKEVLERLSTSPALFLKAIACAPKGAPGLREFLFDPERFRAGVEAATLETLESSLQRLLNAQPKTWTLLSEGPGTEAIVNALLRSTNAAWRAAAVYSVGRRDEPARQANLERALKDTNAWVRAVAISGLAHTLKDRLNLERLLGPSLADPDKRVAQMAILGLLEPETRSAAGMDYSLNFFEFEKIHVWSSGAYIPASEQRPPSVLAGNPPFLETVRQKLKGLPDEDAAMSTLLLAQYGDFTGLDQFISRAPIDAKNREGLEGVVLTAIALSRDTRYFPYLKKALAAAKEEMDFRRLLQVLKGMTGAEARELRLEINKRLREGQG